MKNNQLGILEMKKKKRYKKVNQNKRLKQVTLWGKVKEFWKNAE